MSQRNATYSQVQHLQLSLILHLYVLFYTPTIIVRHLFEFFFFFSFYFMGQYFKQWEKKGRKENSKTQLTLIGRRKKQKEHYTNFFFYGKLVKQKNLFWNIEKHKHFTPKNICFSFFGERSIALQKQKSSDWTSIDIHE